MQGLMVLHSSLLAQNLLYGYFDVIVVSTEVLYLLTQVSNEDNLII